MLKTSRKTILLTLLLACCLRAYAAPPDTIRIVFIGDVMSHGPQVSAALRSGAQGAEILGRDPFFVVQQGTVQIKGDQLHLVLLPQCPQWYGTLSL